MKIKHKIWFEAHGLTIFGPGRDVVFKQIDECHSLNSAAKKLHISYRLAWGKIKVAEERLGLQLVEVNPGEKKMHLTKDARALLAIFDDLEKEIAPILQKAENKIVALKNSSLENEVFTGNKKNFFKSISCLYILPLIDMAFEIFEDYAILMYF
jgi:molybdate transport system regulatory protein